MALSINGYKKYVEQRNFVQNPSFYVMEILPSNSSSTQVTTLYPDSILLPGRNFINTPFAYYGPEFSLPLRREYNELSVNFIVYQDWIERKIIEDWMDTILPYHRKDPSIAISDIYAHDFISRLRDIKIYFTNRANTQAADDFVPSLNCMFYFHRAYPLMITPTSFESNNSGYTIFTVNFAYHSYDFISDKSENNYINKNL